MKTRNLIFILCIVLFAASLMVMVYFYPESFGMTKPYVIIRDGDYSLEGKEALDFFREHVSATCPYTPKPQSANSYDPVDCIWQNTVCPFEGNPKYKKLFDSKGEIYVGMVDEFGSLITCDDIVIQMPEAETTRYDRYLDENNEMNFGLQYDKNGIIIDSLQRIYDWCDYSGDKPAHWYFDWNNSTHHINSTDCKWIEKKQILELYKDTPEVIAFYAKYTDAQVSLRDDHVSYFAGNDEDYRVRMNLEFDKNYEIENIEFHCYVQREHQTEVPQTFILKFLKDWTCNEYGTQRNEN